MMTTSVKVLAVVLFLYINSAVGLQCWSCGDYSCSSQTSVNCSSGQTLCVSRYYRVTYGNYSYNQTYKGCAFSSDCTAEESEFVSYIYGSKSYVSNTTCCDTDNCNYMTASITVPPVGSLKCYSCDPSSYECTANVSCKAQEVCGQAVFDPDGTPSPFHGCVSENLCNNPTLSQKYLYYGTTVSCCNTSHCNVPDLGLQCMTCTDSSCSSQRSVTCSKLAPLCFSRAYAGSYNYGNGTYSEIYKGCASASVCASGVFVSFNYGSQSYFGKSTCCDTDDCNALDPSLPPAGSLQCYSCDPYTEECSANVTCNTLETCFSVSDGTYSFYGCVSENLCDNLTLSQEYFYTRKPLSCCSTSHCNVPQSLLISTDTPPVTTEAPPSSDSKEDQDFSVFSGAVQVLSPALLLSLLLPCVHMFNFIV